MKKVYVNSNKAAEPVGNYPHAIKINNFIFLSGIGPRKKNSKKIPGVELNESGSIVSYNIKEQCIAVFDNIKYILEEAGASFENIIDVSVFLTDMKKDFKVFNKVYNEYFKELTPTRTTVEVVSLPTPIAVELKIIAFLDEK
tara:strand:+ start:195 stop:620 length:426 start_codon:yes stop_codon:yes gene_type:complete